MSVIGSEILAGASGNQGYFIQKSLRFRSSASAYLSRTYITTRTSGQILTYSAWIKRGTLSSSAEYSLFGSYDGSSPASSRISFKNDSLAVYFGGSSNNEIITSAVYRDPSAWYHIVSVIDTTQATASNRIKLYVNGSQITSFGTTNYPAQNANFQFLYTSANNKIGTYGDTSGGFFDGYMAEINVIDGQALTPSSFGEYSPSTGVWQAKKYSGTYGTNGFYLPFSNNSSTTTLGYDFSGNGNNWTTNNISLTSGSTYDSMVDVPTVGELASNYAVVNPLNNTAGYLSVSSGNLNVSVGAYDKIAFGTMALPTTGKWYFEYLVSSAGAATQIGLGDNTVSQSSGIGFSGGNFAFGTSASYSTNDLVGIAIDMDAGTGTIYKNNSSYKTLTGLTGTTWYPAVYINAASGSFNFGQRPFAYTPPTGFKALNTYNLPTPTIGALPSSRANKYFDATTYTGNGTTGQTITNGGGFSPALFWAKARSYAGWNALFDSVRGANSFLSSNSTNAQDNNFTNQAFTSNGFTVNSTYSGETNLNGQTFVAWQWAGNGTGVSNTAGSITSTVSANTTSGFSIVTYTGNGANATVGHGLGVAPKMIIFKNRSVSSDWAVYHGALGATYEGALNTTAAFYTSGTEFQGTNPTSSVFYINGGFGVNNSGNSMVAYCFAEVAGFSKFGSYTGNGSNDGTFVYTGFRPRYVMFKRTNTTEEWAIYDTARDVYNTAELELFANSSSAEYDGNRYVDILSNGFKLRSVGAANNASGSTYIYMAFAESPFKYSLAR